MEKDYLRYSQEQLVRKGSILQHKISSAQEVLEGIARPDFVEKRRSQRPNSNPRWLEKFNLKELEGEAYFNKLAKDIIPVQLRLKQRAIPGFQESLRQVQATQQTTVVTRATTAVSGKGLRDLTNRIIDLAPEAQARSLPPETYWQQARNFAQFVLEVKEEGGPAFNPLEIVNAPSDKQSEVTQEAIRRILAQMILTHPQQQLDEQKMRWGLKIRELIDWLGGGGARLVGRSSSRSAQRPVNEQTKELFTRVIGTLPAVERALVLEISSLKLLESLGYLDLDECNELTFATYLRNAAFEPNAANRDDSFEQLLTTAIERSDAETLDLACLIESLCEPSYAGFIIKKMRESAEYRDFESLLVQFFVSHPLTSRIAGEIADFKGTCKGDEILPHHRRQ